MPAVSTWNVEVISQICRPCYYHLRDFQGIRRYLPLSITRSTVSELVNSRLQY